MPFNTNIVNILKHRNSFRKYMAHLHLYIYNRVCDTHTHTHTHTHIYIYIYIYIYICHKLNNVCNSEFTLTASKVTNCEESVEIKCQLDARDDIYCRSYCLLNMFRAPLCPKHVEQAIRSAINIISCI